MPLYFYTLFLSLIFSQAVQTLGAIADCPIKKIKGKWLMRKEHHILSHVSHIAHRCHKKNILNLMKGQIKNMD